MTYTATYEADILGNPVDVEVSYTMSRGYPQSYGQPAEYPEPTITGLEIHGKPCPVWLYDLIADAIDRDWLAEHAGECDYSDVSDEGDYQRDMRMEAAE